MKTIREILKEGYIRSQLFRIKEDAELWQVEVTQELLDQALKEIEELLLENLPENNNLGYNQALEDTRKAIKELMK